MAEERSNKNSPIKNGAAKRLKILLLEDDPYFFELYANRLRGGGFNVLTEADEDGGMEIAIKEKPDVIVLDISLPNDDDFSFIVNLKERPEISNIPVIILTDLNDNYNKKRGLSLGAADYLIRDEIDFSEIIESIKKAGKIKK